MDALVGRGASDWVADIQELDDGRLRLRVTTGSVRIHRMMLLDLTRIVVRDAARTSCEFDGFQVAIRKRPWWLKKLW